MPRGAPPTSPSAVSHTKKPVPAAALAFAALVLSLFSPFTAARQSAQDVPGAPGEEIVANLAAGRVIYLIVKDAILIATIENPIEPQTHVPAPVQMSTFRTGTVLGPEDWYSPSSQQQIARLDRELPHLRVAATEAKPSLSGPMTEQKDAVDLEMVGQGVRRRATDVVQDLHSQVNLPDDEPFLEILLADYISGYGPEVWQITYKLQQEEQRSDYWTTTVSYPAYEQFYPPEKGQPHTLLEFSYPPSEAPALLDLLRQNDPRFSSLRGSDQKMAEVVDAILDGKAEKLSSAEALPFLRAAVDILAPPKTRVTFSQISQEDGFSWILPPPPEPKSPVKQPEREPGAPSLAHPGR